MPRLSDYLGLQTVKPDPDVRLLRDVPIFGWGPQPGRIPVVLIGYGAWGKVQWFPFLAVLARWRLIDLTVVDRWEPSEAPEELKLLEQEGTLRYRDWEGSCEIGAVTNCRVAYVVTAASAHHIMIHRLLERGARLKLIVCEKPCGDSIEEAVEIFEACRRRGVGLIVADHYLLRPGLQYLLYDPTILSSIGELTKIVALINESRDGGPQQGVIPDLLVHLLDILLILFPGSHFNVDEAYTAQVIEKCDFGFETYTLALGKLILVDGSGVDCELEVGKQLSKDTKSLTLVGTKGTLQLDLINNNLVVAATEQSTEGVHLRWEAHWSYARLILKTLSMI